MYERFVPHKPTDGGTYGSYQTLGDLSLTYTGEAATAHDYSRGLDLRSASAGQPFVRKLDLLSVYYFLLKKTVFIK